MTQTNPLDAAALASLREGAHVFDIGFGRGDFTRSALEAGAAVLAMDPSADACHALTPATNLTVITAAAGAATTYVARVRRALATKARDAELVPLHRLDDLDPANPPLVLRLRAAGQLAAALETAADTLRGADAIRLVGHALVGDDALRLADQLWGFEIQINTIVGVRTWTAQDPHLGAEIDWLATRRPTAAATLTKNDHAAVAIAEGRAADPAQRSRVAHLLRTLPELTDRADVADMLDELALDPDLAVIRAAAWWQTTLAMAAPAVRARRRGDAFDRLTTRMAGSRDQRPLPFPILR